MNFSQSLQVCFQFPRAPRCGVCVPRRVFLWAIVLIVDGKFRKVRNGSILEASKAGSRGIFAPKVSESLRIFSRNLRKTELSGHD